MFYKGNVRPISIFGAALYEEKHTLLSCMCLLIEGSTKNRIGRTFLYLIKLKLFSLIHPLSPNLTLIVIWVYKSPTPLYPNIISIASTSI